MATGGEKTSSGRLTCAVCLEKYRRPKLLPCFHTFCQTCLESLAPPPAPSLTCPACRTVVPLPPVGVAQFQSNFYLEEDLAGEASRDCDVCSESRDAEYRCVECQQYYCNPCRSLHEKMTVSRHHNVLPFSAATATQQDQRAVARKCPKHDFQRQVFFCTVCDVTICPHCKLTSHDGHVTEDLSDAATKARQQLQGMLEEIQPRVRQLETREADTKKAKAHLQAELNSADEVIKKRTDDVKRWAEQAGAEALSTARELCHVIEDSLNQRLEDTQHVMSSLTTRTNHITTVLSLQDNAEVLKLLADIPAADGVGKRITRDGDDTADRVEYYSRDDQENHSASFLLVHLEDFGDTHSAIRRYIGRVSSTKPLSNTSAGIAKSAQDAASVRETTSTQHQEKDTATPESSLGTGAPSESQHDTAGEEQPTSNTDSEHNLAELPNVSTSLASEVSTVKLLRCIDPYTACFQRQPLPKPKKVLTSLSYSSNPGSSVVSMCLTVDNRLWVKYKPPNTHIHFLKLLDNTGAVLGIWSVSILKGSSLTCVGNTVLSPRDWGWFKPSGESGFLDNAPNDWALCSKALPPHVVLYDAESKEYKVHRLQVRSLHPLEVALVAVCKQGVKLEGRPTHFDVSSKGTVFCFLFEKTVYVYCFGDQAKSVALVRLASCAVTTLSPDISTRTVHYLSFCKLGVGKDDCILAITDRRYSFEKVGHVLLVLDQEDGFLRRLHEIGDEDCTLLTAFNAGNRVWLGLKGGRIRVRDLTNEKAK